jgi:hypothetical protein
MSSRAARRLIGGDGPHVLVPDQADETGNAVEPPDDHRGQANRWPHQPVVHGNRQRQRLRRTRQHSAQDRHEDAVRGGSACVWMTEVTAFAVS